MASDLDLILCYNKGCGQKFKAQENSETSCTYHPGGPIFHDAYKGWSCCKKKVTDFTEFLNIKGCTVGCHSNVKPPEPVKAESSSKSQEMIQVTPTPNHRPPIADRIERASADERMIEIPTSIGASLQTQLSKLSLHEQTNDKTLEESEDKTIKIGTSCHNRGCKASYEDEASLEETCVHHPGFPIFHEGMKYWTCCQRKTSDFDAFLAQEGCESGLHNWVKPKAQEKKEVRMDWHQTPSTVCISLFAKLPMPEQTVIKANKVLCEVCIVYDGGNCMYNKTFTLREMIDPTKSNVKLLGTKVEINLKKFEGMSWPSLELEEKKV